MTPIEDAIYEPDELAKYNLAPQQGQPAVLKAPTNETETPIDTDATRSEVNTDTPSSQPVKVKVRKQKPKDRRVKQKQKIHSSSPTTTLRRHISERSWSLRNLYTHIHWKNFVVVVLVPLLGLLLLLLYHPPLVRNTLYLTFWTYGVTLVSINILYHRYWSHHTFTFTNDAMVTVLAAICSGGGITAARNWCSAHRAHHRYCDVTDTDPHNIRRSVVFSHIGWMILTHHPKVHLAIKEARLDMLPNENIVQWQGKHYFYLLVTVGLVLPSLIAGYFWNDYLGGLIYAGFIKIILVQQSVFSVNSIGHTLGSRPYNTTKSARNNYLLSFITLGEGAQNFHHEFPMDYRNSPEWYAFDPTKWTLRVMQLLGQVRNLRKANQSTIDMCLVQQQQRLLDDIRSQLNWGIPIAKLPLFTPDEFRMLAASSTDRFLVVVSGIIHDVTPFAHDHPGGVPLMKASHGKDATQAFSGAVYQHSNAAKNLLATMRIGKLDGSERIYWRQQRLEDKAVPMDEDSGGRRIVRAGTQETAGVKRFGSTAGAA
jgi:stearoyl-CoA desaturase (delta-9 desaturase)